MSNSALVNYTQLSPFCNSPRNHEIDTISIHCYVGQASVKSMGNYFSTANVNASCNYGIGFDGQIGLFVDEGDRTWCTSNPSNDNRAITIECACDKTAPFAINNDVYKSLIELLTDICKRNNIEELKWKGDKSLIGNIKEQNMTVHRWFKNKDCPGEYLYSRHGQIAKAVNAALNSDPAKKPEVPTLPTTPFTVEVLIDDLNYRGTPAMDGTIRGETGKGVFTITKVTNGWGLLKSDVGWIWLGNPSYCTVVNSPSNTQPDTVKDYKVTVNIKNLNIRKGPGTNFGVKTIIPMGVYTIVDERAGSGSSKGWGELKSGEGWISLDFVSKI